MRSGFFNSMKAEGEKFGDRVYRAENWAEYFAQFIGNGVYANPATSMQVRSVSGLIVRISAGSCFINGYTGYADGTDVLTLNYGSGLPRIDRIVLRLDHAARSIYPVVIMGTATESPVPPNIVRNNVMYDLCIAQISVAANTTSVSQANIADTRYNSAVCGIVSGVINQIDTTDLFLQYEAQWNNFVTQLGEDDHVIISGLSTINGKPYDENGNFTLTLDDIPNGEIFIKNKYFIQSGISSVASGSIYFQTPYKEMPTVIACPYGTSNMFDVHPAAITTNYFSVKAFTYTTVYAKPGNTTAATSINVSNITTTTGGSFCWVAIGKI